MADILIRGLDQRTVARIDANAAALGLSRNEYLRRRLDIDLIEESTDQHVSSADLRRASASANDLNDPEVMGAAWR